MVTATARHGGAEATQPASRASAATAPKCARHGSDASAIARRRSWRAHSNSATDRGDRFPSGEGTRLPEQHAEAVGAVCNLAWPPCVRVDFISMCSCSIAVLIAQIPCRAGGAVSGAERGPGAAPVDPRAPHGEVEVYLVSAAAARLVKVAPEGCSLHSLLEHVSGFRGLPRQALDRPWLKPATRQHAGDSAAWQLVATCLRAVLRPRRAAAQIVESGLRLEQAYRHRSALGTLSAATAEQGAWRSGACEWAKSRSGATHTDRTAIRLRRLRGARRAAWSARVCRFVPHRTDCCDRAAAMAGPPPLSLNLHRPSIDPHGRATMTRRSIAMARLQFRESATVVGHCSAAPLPCTSTGHTITRLGKGRRAVGCR